jgi:hypothetical protein
MQGAEDLLAFEQPQPPFDLGYGHGTIVRSFGAGRTWGCGTPSAARRTFDRARAPILPAATDESRLPPLSSLT